MIRIYFILIIILCCHSVVHAVQLAVVQETAGRLDFYTTEGDWHWLGGVKVGALPHEVAISKDGKKAYVANFGIRDYDTGQGNPGNSISVIDIDKKVEKYQLQTNKSTTYKAPHGIKLRPNHANLLYVNTEKDSALLVYDLSKNRIIKTFKLSPQVHNFVFSPDGKYIWLLAGKEGVMRMDADEGKIDFRLGFDTPARGLKYLPQHQLMISTANEIIFMNALSQKIEKRIQHLPTKQILYADITPDGKLVVAPDVWQHRVLIIDVASGKVSKIIKTGLNPVTVVITQDGHYAFVANAGDKHISKINLKNFQHEKIPSFEGPNGIIILS